MRRSRVIAAAVGLVYAGVVLAVPVLHRLHHEAYGDDHVHTAAGTLFVTHADAADEAVHHAAFDADLAALELADVAHAGVLSVDCAFAAYTLASCPAALEGHPHTFGDELLAHQHRRSPFDPRHGEGAPEHLGASLLVSRSFILPPPLQPMVRLAFLPHPSSHRAAPRLTHTSRGPPSFV